MALSAKACRSGGRFGLALSLGDVMKLKFLGAGLICLCLAGAAAASPNGNSGNSNASFNAVLKAGDGGIATVLRPTDSDLRGVGGLVSDLATGSGGQFVALAAGGAPQFVPAVPEPDVALMLLVGLGMIGLVARRRLRR